MNSINNSLSKKSLESRRKSSIYHQRFEELMKKVDEPIKDDLLKNEKKLNIFCNYSQITKKGYYYKYEQEDRFIGINDSRKNKDDWTEFDRIADVMKFNQMPSSTLKKLDYNLIEILYNEKGVKAVKLYINELGKGKNANKNLLPYRMEYNLTSIWKDKSLSFSQKISLTKIAKYNKHVSNVEKHLKIGKRIATVFAAIGLLFGAVPKLNQGRIENEKSNNNTMVDTLERTTNAENETKTNTSKTTENTKTTRVSGLAESYGLKKEDKERILEETEKILERHNKAKDEITEKNTNELQLGSVMNLPNGINFMEGISGGRFGTIGDATSPSNGFYVVDYSAEVSENGVSSEYGLEGKIKNNNLDKNQFVHISFIAGANNIEEAKKIIEEQKNNAKNNCVDERKIQPRGWVSKNVIQQLYNMQQKNNHEQDMEK